MCDLFVFILKTLLKPFKSRLFILSFFFFFIPISTFGIYYKWFEGSSDKSFLSYFTPETIFTFTIPLMASIIMEGVLTSTNKLSELEKDSAEFQLFRDSMVLSVIVMLFQAVLIYNSLSKDNVLLSLISVVVLFIFWILICSTKSEFSPSKRWRPTGNADTSSSSSISNG